MKRLFENDIPFACELICSGELVAVPTETVYGLAGNGLDPAAVERIYEVKGRPAVKPLSLMVPDAKALDVYCEAVPEAARLLADKFWPGPLTIVLKSKKCVPEIVRAGGETVGLRCPDHPLTLELLRQCKLPLAAPSANPSDLPSPKNADKVIEYFDDNIEAVIDGGECGIGYESTIIDMSSEPYKILRQGALSSEAIEEAMIENMLIVGITGGSGSGKTTALEVLSDFGGLVLDCDRVYHELLEKNMDLILELSHRFPGTVIDSRLDRKALGAIVFKDEQALKDLNKITHAFISREIRKRIISWAMSGGKLVGLDAIELIGSGISKQCDILIGVLCDKATRIKRIVSRDNIDEASALLRIEAQRPDSYFVNNCSHILYNNGTEQEFRDSVVNLLMEVINNG